MEAKSILLRLAKRSLFTVLGVYIVSIGWLFGSNQVAERAYQQAEQQIQAEVEALNAIAFDDLIEYHGIYPVDENPGYGDLIFHYSDAEIKPLVEELGPVFIQWVEHIECDYSPDDEIAFYQFYRNVETTDRYYSEARERPDKTIKSGYPAISAFGDHQLVYPSVDADCRLGSTMTIKLKYDVEKKQQKFGKPAKVRRGK